RAAARRTGRSSRRSRRAPDRAARTAAPKARFGPPPGRTPGPREAARAGAGRGPAPARPRRRPRAPAGGPRSRARGRGGWDRTRLGRGPSPAVIPLERRAGFVRAEVGPAGEESACLGDCRLARVALGDRARAVFYRHGVDYAAPPPVLARERAPVRVEAPAHARLGERREGRARPDR